MKNYIYYITLLTVLVNLRCATSKTDDQAIELEGVWQVDSIVTYRNGHVQDLNQIKWMIKMTENEIHYCGENNGKPITYEIITSKSQDPIFRVKTENGLIESALSSQDQDHFLLVSVDTNDRYIEKYWYHSRSTQLEMDRFCKGEY